MGLRSVLGLIQRRSALKAKLSKLRAAQRPTTLTDFCSTLRDQDCVVFGSAPKPDFSDHNGGPIVCCNSSAASLQRLFGLAPSYTFMHCHVLTRWKQSDREARDALQDVKRFGRIVIFDDQEGSYSVEMIASQADEITPIDWASRHDIVAELLGAPLPFLSCSTGAMTAACVLRAGARSVRLVGFSFDQKGHSYNGRDRHRNHVRSDVALFALLAQAGYKISSREPSVAMVLAAKID